MFGSRDLDIHIRTLWDGFVADCIDFTLISLCVWVYVCVFVQCMSMLNVHGHTCTCLTVNSELHCVLLCLVSVQKKI